MALSDSPPTQLPYRGLSTADVEFSRQKNGANVLTPPEREPWWKLYLEKFDDPVIRILLIAAVVAIGVGFVEGKFAEGVGIIVAVLLATGLAFVNEYRAAQEFEVLNRTNDDTPVKAIRNGGFTIVPKRDLVVGDVVQIETGEEVPADGQLLEAVSLSINEARLTGESRPSEKAARGTASGEGAEETAYGADRLLRGTTVVDGYGLYEVTAVGDGTEIGQTARTAAEETDEETPLNKQLERLSKLIGVVGTAVAGLTFAALLVRGFLVGELVLTGPQWVFCGLLMGGVLVALARVWLPIVFDGLELFGSAAEPPGWLENETLAGWLKTLLLGALLFAVGIGIGYGLGWVPASPSDWLPAAAGAKLLMYFMIAVTVIVVAVPEGLAMSVTLSLAYSMRKMTAENTLVRRMHACETIGAATVICSDKTGTLTLNEMRVFRVHFPACGTGFPTHPDGPGNPSHGVGVEAPGVSPLIAEAIAVNSTAQLSREEAEVRALGNPTEGALLLWLHEQGVDYVPVRHNFAISSQWTFSTERKFMATLGMSPHGDMVMHLKGAPELLLDRATHEQTPEGVQPLGDAERERIVAALKDAQQRGMRTLGLAYRSEMSGHEGVDLDLIVTNLIWLGFVAIADPIRPEVPPAIKTCREAGVQVKMVTGDNPETAQEIARQIGLWDAADGSDHHLSGREFQALPDEEAKHAAQNLKVLSRARPLDKLRLVRLLQETGEVVAVTGDGTNDAPALNHANVGLAMGRTGTAVAKEASDIILLDDSFRSILNAIMWGRSLYENIQRFILFQLTINVAALGIALLGPFLGVEFPLTVIQMLWVNLIMDTFAALALATEPAHAAVLRRPPRDPEAFIVTPPMARNILAVAGVFLAVLIVFLLRLPKDSKGEPDQYWLSVFFSVFVLLQFWNLFNARCLGQNHSAFVGLFANRAFVLIAAAILIGQVLLVQFGGSVFRTVPLAFADWAVILLATSTVLWIGELWRWFVRRAAVA